MKIPPISWLCLALMVSGAPARAEPVTRAAVDPLFSRFNAETPGCAVGVMEDGKPVVLQGYGMADLAAKRPIAPSTLFDLASVSKQFTGAAIALLALEGKLSEEDDVRRYIPELRTYGKPITLRHLLHHTSGLRDYSTVQAFGSGRDAPHAEIVKLIARQSALNFPTGTEHLYSNSNYVLLAEVVQRVTRRSFEDFVAARFFRPLGMKHTGFRAPGLALGYLPAPGGGYQPGRPRLDKLGSSGIVSSVEDMMLWFGNFETGKVGGRAMIERMLTPGRLDDGTPLTYAYGIGVRRDYRGVPGLTLLNHSGSLPEVGIATMTSYFPGEKFGVALLCNAANAPTSAWVQILERHLGARLPAQASSAPAASEAPTPPAAAQGPADPARFAGLYHDPVTDQVRSFLVEKGGLTLETGGRKFPLQPAGEGRFSLNGMVEFLFADQGGRRRVEEHMGGKPVLFHAVAPAERADAAQFEGLYGSPDADGTIRVSSSGDMLVAATATEEVPLTPLYKDAFASPSRGWVNATFIRDAAGAVTALTITTPAGIRRMRFDRLRVP